MEKKRWAVTSHRLSIASAAAVLFVTVSILFWMKENNRQKITAKQTKKVEIIMAPKTSKVQDPTQVSATNVAADKTATKAVAIAASATARTKEYVYKAKEKAITIPAQETHVAVIKPAEDSAAIFANSANVAAARIAVAKISNEESKAAASKKQNAREIALPGRVAGIYVDNAGNNRQTESIINGRVYTKNDRQPMPGVTVSINGSNKATTTNSKGEFTLPVDSNSKQSLSIAYLGFTTKVVNTSGNQSVDVELEQSKNSLSEVSVVGPDKNVATKALTYSQTTAYYPKGGWENYESYLVNNNNLTKNGLNDKEVILKFEVKTNGTPTKIIIVKSQGKTFDNEAIRLIKDGPNWLPIDKNKKGTSQVTIKF